MTAKRYARQFPLLSGPYRITLTRWFYFQHAGGPLVSLGSLGRRSDRPRTGGEIVDARVTPG